MLKANGISPRRLGDMLLKLEAAHRARVEGKDKRRQDDVADGPLTDYYSSHPATRERIESLAK
jgi:Zn-dependent protease with chaperone function